MQCTGSLFYTEKYWQVNNKYYSLRQTRPWACTSTITTVTMTISITVTMS